MNFAFHIYFNFKYTLLIEAADNALWTFNRLSWFLNFCSWGLMSALNDANDPVFLGREAIMSLVITFQ